MVDEDSDSRSRLTAGLRTANLEVAEVATLVAAEAVFMRTNVDLVVVAVELLDRSGAESIAKFRDRNRSVLIVLTTGLSPDGQDVEQLTKEFDVAKVIEKPIDIDTLVTLVGRLLEERKATAAASDSSALAAEFAALRSEFTAKLPGKLQELEAAVRLAKYDRESIEIARGLAHRLRGSSGSYGHPDLGEAAGHVEDLLSEALANPALVGTGRWELIDGAMRDMRRCLDRGPEVDEWGVTPSAATQKVILVVDDDPDFLQFAQTVGKKLMLNVATARSASEAVRQARSTPLLGAVLDVHLDSQTSFALARQIRDTDANAEIPIAFASVDNCIETRVAAIEAGGTRFFEKPMSAENFAELAQQFVTLSEANKGKVLIVDDDPDILEHYSIQLRAAAIGVETLDSAVGITEKLDQIVPDVLLLDINLPGISGLDVCRALRMSERFEAIPILIITAQTDDHTRLSAFRAGACDVVTKPVIPEEFMARVGVQLERVRFQRDRADKDPLSGLLTRRALVTNFERAQAAATRAGSPLSIILLDLDRFKAINDTFGHSAGDQVIAGFGNLLRRRFRVEDIRGRWGGEEFLVVIPGQDGMFAERAARTILREFSELCFESEDGRKFSATFTAGVAAGPEDGSSMAALVRRADERLYAGKQQGRNQVVGPHSSEIRRSDADLQEDRK